MYITDLTPMPSEPGRPAGWAIGWLDESHAFSKGPVSEDLLEQVLELCTLHRKNVKRGFHSSPFLFHRQPGGYPVRRGELVTRLGDAEIHVVGEDGRIFIAPNLVYHYMRDCGYLPPQEFLNAVRRWSLRR